MGMACIKMRRSVHHSAKRFVAIDISESNDINVRRGCIALDTRRTDRKKFDLGLGSGGVVRGMFVLSCVDAVES